MMNETKKTLLSLGLVVLGLLVLALAKPLFASVRCETTYEGEVCYKIELMLDKKVWDPGTEAFVENLGTGDYKFAPGDEIAFQIKVKNLSDEAIENIDVRDYLPEYLEHLSGDLSYKISRLEVDESEEREVKVRVVSAEEFPDDKLACVINKAEAWTDDDQDEDTAQVCIEEKVKAAVVEELPPTGPHYGILLLGVSMLSGLAGLVFKKLNWL
jgi:uncharacterized repeat protein (TIGR01451 family)